MKLKKLVIIGAGDFGREVVHLVERINQRDKEWEILGYIDDNKALIEGVIDGYPIVGGIEWLQRQKDEVFAVCAIGNGITREQIVSKISNTKVKYATLIDPDAIIFRDCNFGEGCIVCAGCIISINCSIGKHVIINLNSTLGHDDYIGSFCTINPGTNISGKVCLNKGVDLGTGTKIIQGINIGERTISGAGAVVVRDIADNKVVVGCPAKIIKERV